jgi:hypothetical protein
MAARGDPVVKQPRVFVDRQLLSFFSVFDVCLLSPLHHYRPLSHTSSMSGGCPFPLPTILIS